MNFPQQHSQLASCSFDRTAYDHRMPEELIYSAHRNHKELTELINLLFECHSRLLVIRIDLKYQGGLGKTIPLETVQMHREQLLGDRRNYPKEFSGMVGYAWSLEYGEQENGYHYHLILFYNGAERWCDIGIGHALGNLWNTITNGTGCYYISNHDKEKLAREGCLGIGMIGRNDTELRLNLIEKVAAYITKKCTAFDIQSSRTGSGAFRTFGKSRIPKPLDPNIPRRGRPAALNDFLSRDI